MRLAHTQVWPAFRYFEAIAPLTAISISASSNTMNGALPPSSSDNFLTVPAHCSISNLPTSVEPVKVSLRTIGFEVISPPISFEGPVTQENTPFGTPARSANSHKARAENGVAVAGFSTIVQPAAKAGPALRVIIAAGKFHGVIAAHTPIGSLVTTMRLSVACSGGYLDGTRPGGAGGAAIGGKSPNVGSATGAVAFFPPAPREPDAALAGWPPCA